MKKLLFLLLIVVFSGCVTQQQQVTDDGKVTLRFSQVKIYDPTFVAAELGYFDDEDIKIEWMGEMYGGPQVLVAAAAGDLDAGIAATTAITNARAAGTKIKGVVDLQSSYPDSPIHIWYVLNDSSIHMPQDLVGKKIGVNTLGASFHYTTLAYLEKNGIGEDQVELVVIPHPNMEQALRQKQIDVAGMVDPFTAKIEQGEGVRRLFTTVDAIDHEQVAVIFFTEKFMQEHPEAVRGFIRAYLRAIDYSQTNPEDFRRIMANSTGVDEKYITPHRFTQNARVDSDSAQMWIDMLEKYGSIKPGSVSVSDIITNEFNPRE